MRFFAVFFVSIHLIDFLVFLLDGARPISSIYLLTTSHRQLTCFVRTKHAECLCERNYLALYKTRTDVRTFYPLINSSLYCDGFVHRSQREAIGLVSVSLYVWLSHLFFFLTFMRLWLTGSSPSRPAYFSFLLTKSRYTCFYALMWVFCHVFGWGNVLIFVRLPVFNLVER